MTANLEGNGNKREEINFYISGTIMKLKFKKLSAAQIVSFKTNSSSFVILCMLRFLPYNIQLLTRNLSSNLGCLKNTSRGHLSSYFLLKLGRNTTQQHILEVGTVKKIPLIFSMILGSVKNNCYYKICLSFNCQFFTDLVIDNSTPILQNYSQLPSLPPFI